MSALSPYLPLQITETFSRIEGRAWWVRDEECQFLWNRVEYVGRRLQCWCDQGQAHAEQSDVEAPCAHLQAVIDERMATQKSSRPHAPVNAASFCD